MVFDYTAANPAVQAERDEYVLHWKDNGMRNGFEFFNNFFFKYLPHQGSFGRKNMLKTIKGSALVTFGDEYTKLYTELGTLDALANYSELFLSMPIISFYQKVDDFLKTHGCMHTIASYTGSLWDLLATNLVVGAACTDLYFSLRKEGFWRYKDLIA